MDTETAFAVLELDFTATEEEINKQYRIKAKVAHPDKNTDKDNAHQNFIRLKDAHDAALRHLEINKQSDVPADRKGWSKQEARSSAHGPEPPETSWRPQTWWGPSATQTEEAQHRWRREPPVTGTQPTLAQMKVMDQQAVLPVTLDNIRKHGEVPKETRTWGQLKQWLATNPVKFWPPWYVLYLQCMHCIDIKWIQYAMRGSPQRPKDHGDATRVSDQPENGEKRRRDVNDEVEGGDGSDIFAEGYGSLEDDRTHPRKRSRKCWSDQQQEIG